MFRSGTIARNSFRKTRLIPVDPEIVLTKMKEYKQLQKQEKRAARTPTPPTSPVRQSSLVLPSSPPAFATPPPRTRTPPPPDNWASWDTPLTIRTRRKGLAYVAQRIDDAINGTPLTPSVKRVHDKVERAAERLIISGGLTKQRVHDLSIIEQERERRNDKDNNKIVQKYGEIYVYQGREDIRANDEDAAKIINMRNARQAKPMEGKV